MRQAILSDIHGNLVALDAVLDDCQGQQVTQVVCLGDMTGYGPEPAECMDRLRECCAWSLAGNHDVAVTTGQALGFNRIARQAVEWHRRLLRPGWYCGPRARGRWRWFEGLIPWRLEGSVLYVHASPRDPLLEYVEEGDVADLGFGPSTKILDIFDRIPWLAFCGHSHRPGVVSEEYIWYRPAVLPGFTCELPRDQKVLVNVGSVGQPRDQNPAACYVIHDSEQATVQFRRVTYDVAAAQARFMGHPELHERCWQRLAEGV